MAKEEKVLKEVNKKIEIKLSKKVDPKDFYKTRKGLYIWSNFQDRIVSNASTIKEGTKFSISSFDLVQSADDEAIEAGLPKTHIFNESDVCGIIAEMIDKQPKGEEGDMITTGYANLFYTKSFVVGVRWRAVHGEWLVAAWDRGGGAWDAGNRVFSPAN